MAQLQEAERLIDPLPAPRGAVAVWIPYLLAMTNFQLGNQAEAQRQFDQAIAAAADPPRLSWPFEVEPPEWSRQVIADLLGREAATARRSFSTAVRPRIGGTEINPPKLEVD